jgi:hypothetical protein
VKKVEFEFVVDTRKSMRPTISYYYGSKVQKVSRTTTPEKETGERHIESRVFT